MIQALADQVELNSLVMTANKKTWLAAAHDRLDQGVAAIQAGANGLATAAGLQTAPPAATAQPGDDPAGITNRSPRTINNTYPPPPAIAAKSDAPWVALIAIALLIATALGLAWMLAGAAPKPVTPTTAVPQGVQVPNTQWSATPFDPFAQPAATK